MRLSDAIEEFIKELWEHDEAEVELKRNELAEYFRCAPSQINYVLSTRFTPDHGYAIESRRGGGDLSASSAFSGKAMRPSGICLTSGWERPSVQRKRRFCVCTLQSRVRSAMRMQS